MAEPPQMYMVGLITRHMSRTFDFYRRLGVDFDQQSGTHREARVRDLTFFLDERPEAWHPGIEGRPYPWLLEFFFESLEDLRAKVDELVAEGHDLIDVPYPTAFGMWFAFVADPDGNTVLLSAQRDEAE